MGEKKCEKIDGKWASLPETRFWRKGTVAAKVSNSKKEERNMINRRMSSCNSKKRDRMDERNEYK